MSTSSSTSMYTNKHYLNTPKKSAKIGLGYEKRNSLSNKVKQLTGQGKNLDKHFE